MRTFFTVFFVGLTSLVFGQSTDSNNVLMLSRYSLFSDLCLEKLSSKYNIVIDNHQPGCVPLEMDSLRERHSLNLKVVKRLEPINGENWYFEFEKDLEECEQQTCPFDSLQKYYFRLLGAIILRFERNQGTLGPEHKCILENTIMVLLERYPNLELQISGHSTPDEGSLSILRASDCRDFLIASGFSESRITVVDNGFTEPLEPDSNASINRRIEFKALRVE